jgi:transcription elongation factor Elf1
MDVMGELQTMIQTSGFSRAKLSALLREITPKDDNKVSRPKRVPQSPVTQFSSIKRKFTCLHCSATFSSIIQLREKEDTVGVTEEGKVMIINSASPAEVSLVTSSCDHCSDFIKSLTRDELESRYITLLRHSSLTGKNIFGQKITTEREIKL